MRRSGTLYIEHLLLPYRRVFILLCEDCINSATTGVTINSAGDHSHSVTVASAGAHVHTFTTASVGGGAAHTNMQPTLFGANVFIYGGW